MTPARPPGSVHVSGYDPEFAVRVERTLAGVGFDVAVVDSLRELRERIGDEDVALVVLTGGLSEPSTRDLLRHLGDAALPVAVLALADRVDPPALERLRRMGIDEVIEKPFDADELTLVARRLLLREELVGRTHIVGRSEALKEALERIAQYAPVNSTVLIEGESGTGKELAARAIHDLSPRAGGPFIPVNCAALTESLLESELFGHEKGAFTGATSLRKGRFEIADGGTLFLDEVGEMPQPIQVKLLRVLEEREFMRVGGSSPIRVDVRVIAATNREIARAVADGDFRRDLFYRLNVLSIRMPPLRERREDVPLLVHHFVQEFCRENDRQFTGITDEAMEILVNYDWPGNVRELRNLVESMLVLTPGTKVRPKDIPSEIYERARPERLLPVALGEGEETEEGGRATMGRLEALLGYFYRELKEDLDEIRHDNAETRAMVAEGRRQLEWLQEVEVEPVGEVPVVDPRERRDPAGDVGSGGPESPITSAAAADVPAPTGDDVPAGSGLDGFEVGMRLEELERIAIERTLETVDGNRRKASEILGIGERTLYRKIDKYDL